ncbi:hypothetical protein BC937DRAFT_88085 [Endogone sp. FLAS-F59071]|nr:hypothetical protein BC937DRAFT_88085 [Endogone sp. FLAS-F59071]|eukprot:RUS19001.1 hypothetical protein BC937DRAFT_88085 [Endogone sp. FLAS-F59071]
MSETSSTGGIGPGYKDAPCVTIYNNTMFVWGGGVVNETNPPYPYKNFTSTTFPLTTTNITWTDLSWDIPVALANNNTFISISPCVVSPTGILVVGGTNLFGYDITAANYVSLNLTGANPLNALSTRTNVRMVNVKDSVYYFGGYSGTGLNQSAMSDYYILNMTTWQWSSSFVQNPQSIPPNFDASSMAYVDNGAIYMIAGSQPFNYTTNVYKFDINSQTWSLVQPSNPGAWTSGFDTAESFTYNNFIFTFDGYSEFNATIINYYYRISSLGYAGLTNVTHILDTSTNTLIQQSVYNSPQYAIGNSFLSGVAASHEDSVIFVWDRPNRTIYNPDTVYVYNLTIRDWTNYAALGPYIYTTTPNSAPSSLPSASGTSTNSSPNVAVIGGAVGGSVVVIAAIVIAAVFFFKRRNGRFRVPQSSPPHSSEQQYMPPQSLGEQYNPDIMQNIIMFKPDGIPDEYMAAKHRDSYLPEYRQ